MREAKYRAYHRRTKEKINVDFIDTKHKVIGEYDFRNNQRFYPINEVVLVQYTGLKDKEGREIYEGDIVRVSDDYGNTDFTEGGIGTVCGMEDLFMWYIDGDVHNGLYDVNQSSYIEVIGNIHENPELLEVE